MKPLVKKTFASDNEHASQIAHRNNGNKVKAFHAKMFKYSIQEEKNPIEIQMKENKRLISNIDLRFLDNSNYMLKLFILNADESIFRLKERVLSFDIIEKNELVKENEIEIKVQSLLTLIHDSYSKYDTKIIVFIKEFKEYELPKDTYFISRKFIYTTLQEGLNYIYFPSENHIINNKEIYIKVKSQSEISTKGFLNDLSNKVIEEETLTLVINNQYDSTYGIYLHKGKGYAYFTIL